MDAIRKSIIRLRINSFSAVIIPYLEGIVKYLLSTRKICGAVGKEKALLTYLLITLKNHRKISVIVKCDYHATL